MPKRDKAGGGGRKRRLLRERDAEDAGLAPPPRTYRNFIHCEAQGFVFAYVPKVACTNWKSVFRHLAGHADYLDSRLAHNRAEGGLRYLDLDGPDAAILDDPAVRKFAMVRNPASRILSAYLNKVESRLGRPPGAGGDPYFDSVLTAINQYRTQVLGDAAFPEVTFDVFLHWLENATGVRDGMAHLRADEHWQTQSVLLRWPSVRFDMIGRFENMAADADALLRQMGCRIPFPTQQDVRFRPTEADRKLNLYLNPENTRIINRLFAADFAQFGYPPGEDAAMAGAPA